MGGAWIMIHGRLTRDPEEKHYRKHDGADGKMVTFGIAYDARFGDKTYYRECTVSGKTGDIVYAHLKKGSEVIVYGEPAYNEKDGKRFENVNVDRFDFCGGKQQDGMKQIAEDTPF